MAEHNVIIYSSPTCPHCNNAKKFLDEQGVEYTDYDVISDEEKKDEMVEKSGAMSVPVIDVDGQIITGFDKDALKKALDLN